jgi:hypothetical protein
MNKLILIMLCICVSSVYVRGHEKIEKLDQVTKISIFYIGYMFDATGTLGFRFKVNEQTNLDILLRGWAANRNGDREPAFDEKGELVEGVMGVWLDYKLYGKDEEYKLNSTIKVTKGSDEEKMLLALIKSAANDLDVAPKAYLHLLMEVIRTRDKTLKNMFTGIDHLKVFPDL